MIVARIALKIAATTVIGFGLIGAAQAAQPTNGKEKSQTFEGLMTQKGRCGAEDASLLACGLQSLNERLDAVEPVVGADMTATYDTDNNLIRVRATSIQGLHATEENCRNVVNTLRYDAGVDGRRGWLLTDYATRWTYNFLPPMTSRTKTRVKQEEVLDSAYAVEVLIQYDDVRVSCAGPILSKDISVSSR